ncbi:hypothetical protein BCR36DRAFT_313638 [Piromyces finnis]|uniref:EGF-like domain-containing protein n=1 Tax=Piromyces finnis TaxID=1754191 RepID=A0A1Y1UHH1_9FUNG|nr:hypothetical protein BCR36DRAFT_313638 [Piromyces finnis]|eukprot:ORX37498.1 hypothetical protein BCR36DRAFT_313638 [Piromyces finnis]
MHFNNDLNINIVNNTFSNNISDSNGGVICIDSIDNTLNLDLNLTSNTFEKNEGVNGGAIYINDNNNSLEKRNDRSYIMIINDNIFKENKAENYGGALYSRINTTISSISHSKNNIFKHNKSGILGGAIYSQNSREYNILDLQYNNENVFKDNTANDIINDYTSKPAYISLNTTINTWGNRITSGNFLPMLFILYDEYDNIMNITNYYNNIILKVNLEKKFKSKHILGNEKNYYLTGNIASFASGKCNFNNLRIYANPDTYLLRLSIEGYKDKIELKFSDIEIEIKECNNNEIKRIDTLKNITYCETPICMDSCPIQQSAICIPPSNNTIENDPTKNICKCLDGWKETNCNTKIMVDIR